LIDVDNEKVIKSIRLANCGEIISKSNKSLINCEQRRVKKLTLKRIYSTRITYDECDFKVLTPRLVSAISIMRSYLTYTHFE